MKMHSEKKLAELEGFDTKPKQFQIKQNARAFEILSSNIYSDKVLAVVRELSCNAYDAHVAAGKADVPFEVHMPNSFEPWFSVTDYGIGLSDDKIMNLYTTYFDSTKNEDNDMIGGLGLGSKSPFAYTDQFTVTSRYNGEKRTYTAYVDESGAPSITCVLEETTTEPNGLTVQMSVQPRDFSEFHTKAISVYHRFVTQPTITGQKVNLAQVRYTATGPNYKLREHNSDYHGGHVGIWVVQGQVAYPLEADKLGDLSYEVRNFVNYVALDLIVPIGTVGITASRERLNYDRQTIKFLNEQIDVVLEELPKVFQAQFDACTSLYEAVKLYSGLSEGHNASYLINALKKPMTYKGEEIDCSYIEAKLFDMVQVIDPVTFKPVEIPDPDNSNKMIPLMKKEHWGEVLTYSQRCLQESRPQSPTSDVSFTFYPRKDQRYVFIDTMVKGGMNNFIRHNFPYTYGQGPFTNVVVIKAVAARFPDILKAMGDIPADKFIMASTLEPTPKIEKAAKPRNKKVYKTTRWESNDPNVFMEQEYDINNGGTYLLVHSKIPTHPAKQEKPETGSGDWRIMSLIPAMMNLNMLKDDKGQPIEDVWAFNYHIRNEIESEPATKAVWFNLHDIVQARWKELYADPNFLTNSYSSALMESLITKTWLLKSMRDLKKYLSELDPTSPFVETMNKLYVHQENAEKLFGFTGTDTESLSRHAETFKTISKTVELVYGITNPVENVQTDDEVKGIDDVLMLHYPLLWKIMSRSSNWSSDSFSPREALNYIKLCDAHPSVVSQINP